ncbi:restriction endonuclease subunit S [Staphylococcus aureus]|uniref:restriction endonuclease subunit S n=1 Tax=Staphylococcus aureus TaxID=1280 RepID=UPI0020270BE6|nr:restriction endonuclease subunit S [Staphylococcus aureus]MCL9691071.1 restriction endonuclease subunit S [Staphylococcus aureus]
MSNTQKNNVPELRFPGFEDEWEEKRFADFTKINQGLQIAINERKTEYSPELYFYITNEFLRPNSQTKYFIENPPQSVIANKEDILMTRTGNTGKVVTNVFGAFHNNFFKIKFDKNLYDRLFLVEVLNSSKIQNKILSLAGSSTIPDLNHSDFYSISSSYPLLREQQKIGQFFSKLDRQIELQEQKLELLQQQKKGYMQKIFSQELRFKDENGEDYPEWEEKQLGELGVTYAGLSGKAKEDFGFGKDVYVSYVNVFKNNIATLEMVENVSIKPGEKQNNVKFGDILFTTSSEVPHEVGMSSVWLYEKDNVYLNSFCFGFRTTVSFINPIFLARYLRSFEMRKLITILAQGSTRFNISKKELMKLIVKIPRLDEQNRIINLFSILDGGIELQSMKVRKLKKRKQGLLQKMFI